MLAPDELAIGQRLLVTGGRPATVRSVEGAGSDPDRSGDKERLCRRFNSTSRLRWLCIPRRHERTRSRKREGGRQRPEAGRHRRGASAAEILATLDSEALWTRCRSCPRCCGIRASGSGCPAGSRGTATRSAGESRGASGCGTRSSSTICGVRLSPRRCQAGCRLYWKEEWLRRVDPATRARRETVSRADALAGSKRCARGDVGAWRTMDLGRDVSLSGDRGGARERAAHELRHAAVRARIHLRERRRAALASRRVARPQHRLRRRLRLLGHLPLPSPGGAPPAQDELDLQSGDWWR